MHPKGYFVFHLNLAFSSVDKSSWGAIVDRCYWPLLDIVSDLQVPLGIELSAWTLNGIQETCPEWVDKFKQLLGDGKCELIGSGYCQIIAPLVPYEVNVQNQRIGLDIYQSLLGVRPKIALVNEMAYSDSVIDILAEVGYSAFIMDRDNIQLALGLENELLGLMPGLANGVGPVKLPVLWADSILFQKLQHIAHGDISIDDYVGFIKGKIAKGDFLFPLYSNDAETFDFRPGRFKEESQENASGEWTVIRKIMEKLNTEFGFEYVLPSVALEIQHALTPKKAMAFTSAGYPVPVKKQPKYNIARWAVTGRADTWLNTMCFRIYNKLTNSVDLGSESWKNLLELWSSDLRTHLTDQRWSDCKAKVADTLTDLKLPKRFGLQQEQFQIIETTSEILAMTGVNCQIFGDGIYLVLETSTTKLILNLRRGIAIESLCFKSLGEDPCIGTIKHGYLNSIVQGADYYSGGMVIESPVSQSKITDLHPVIPTYLLSNNGDLTVKVKINTSAGIVTKYIKLSSALEQIKISYQLSELKRSISSVKLGNVTLSPQFSKAFKSYSCKVGGARERIFNVAKKINHSLPANRFVSSNRGFSSTSGELSLDCSGKSLYLTWDPSECTPLCFIDHDGDFTRVSFSVCEIDETSRESDRYGDFEVVLSSSAL